VREIINHNQAAIAAAVMATEEGLKEGDRGLLLAQQSGAANAAIITEVETTARLATAINLATQQQRTASEQVVLTMREMVGITQQVATSSREMLAAVSALNEVAQDLTAARAAADPPAAAPLLPGAPPQPTAARPAPAPI
jgi:methyl-accepting chemotaxis protein